ncbi:MAG TPA: YetF domain-containing protein, partial [Sporolactobacillaceae bacterium]|nr:YetF domain-containing protein [Sporolactobacillaceae bacterium]
VELAVYETNGKISVLKKAEQSPVTPKQFGMTLEPEKKPTLVINNGKPIQSAIDASGFTKGWLVGELSKKGIKDFSEVYAAQVDSKGQLYVDLKDDQKSNAMSNDRQALLAKIKKIAADLDVYSLDTDNPEAKAMYKEEAKKVKELEDKLRPYLH